jgi:sigma-E factor negative regulatory protein RseA
MNEQMRESLSALMDNEANEIEVERLLSQIGSDSELRQTWVRYQAARSVVGGELTAHFDLDISARVRAAVQDSDNGQRESTAGLRQRLVRPLASFAVAASVTATVVLGGQQLAQIGSSDPYGGQQVAGAVSSPVGIVHTTGARSIPASFGTQPMPVLQPATRTAYEKLARQRMGRYMQEHAQHAALNSPQGLVPYARVPMIRE